MPTSSESRPKCPICGAVLQRYRASTPDYERLICPVQNRETKASAALDTWIRALAPEMTSLEQSQFIVGTINDVKRQLRKPSHEGPSLYDPAEFGD